MDKKYDYLVHEKNAQQKWRDEKTYSRKENTGPLYSIDTPPPTVSGALHIGHIFSYTQTDIIARYKRMSGFSVCYPFGFDDNGLPTERFVEKKRQISAHYLKRSEFIEVCLQETHAVEKQFQDLWQQIGLSVDWDLCYSTISDQSRKISQESFIRLFNKGFIYRKYEPALYCTTCRTSVAQAELDDIEKPSFFNTIKFYTEDGAEILIGTTRPEFLFSCVAVLYHPNDARYQHLQGKKIRVPLFNHLVPVIADEVVLPEKGTGLVMCCTFGDKTDIAWYKKYNLEYRQSIGLDGKWLESTGLLAGLKVAAARAAIIERLKAENFIVEQRPIDHAVNVHERCKQEIEYMAISQWFLKILEYKKKFIELADTITWAPSFMKSRYQNWVENIQWDWCLSRQRFFGIPFPVWHCNACQNILLAPLDQLPVDPQEKVYPGKICTRCGSDNITPDTDVMDTWNTSSLTPYICYSLFSQSPDTIFTDKNFSRFIPMAMRPQAHDIIRTWAFYTIVKTWMHHETIPWQSIVISGHVLSDSSEKISKSKENAKNSPEALLKNYPADVIRYWTASGSLGQDTAFSETQLKIGQRLVTKLWNAFLFIKEHTAAVPLAHTAPSYLGTVNEWLLHAASDVYARYEQYMSNHDFNLALDVVESFFWRDFCDNYLELIKEQLFKPELYSKAEIDATHWTLYTVGLRILQLYCPYLPHITEVIYGYLYKTNYLNNDSIHTTTFKEVQAPYQFDASVQIMGYVLSCITQVRRLKSEYHYSLKAPIGCLTIHGINDHIMTLLRKEEQLLKGITHASTIEYNTDAITTGTLTDTDNVLKVKVSILLS